MSSQGYKYRREEEVQQKLSQARVGFFALGSVFGGIVSPAVYAFARWLMGY